MALKNGQHVLAFERAFAEYVGAKYAIALCNGTATIHTALVALGVKPGDRVAVPPLTMSATTIAVLHAGATPVFCDVDPDTWLMDEPAVPFNGAALPVSLYGLHHPMFGNDRDIDDAAQTLRPHGGGAFTSYSFQASKILPLGEGGMLVTDDEELATKAREFSSLGYRMRADQPRIDPNAIKSPTFDRHHSLGWNYRMNDVTAREGLLWLGEIGRVVPDAPRYTNVSPIARALSERRHAASLYAQTVDEVPWLTPQYVPDGWTHDYWCYPVACDTPERAIALADAVVKHGGERPYPAWKLTYLEPAFELLRWNALLREQPIDCPVAESLQPRLLQFQTNKIESAQRNATALDLAIDELSSG